MADKTAATISEKGHEPDKSEDPLAEFRETMGEHHVRLTRLEDHVGLAPEPGVAAEETGKHEEKKPNYGRKRH